MRKKGVSPVGTGVNTDKEALLPRITAAKKREGGEDGAETDMFYSWRRSRNSRGEKSS